MILDAFNTVNSPEALFPPHIWLIVFVVMLYFLPGRLLLFPILFAPSPQISFLWFLVIIQGDGSSDLSRLATFWQCILLDFLPACLLAFPTTKIKTPKTHTGVQGHSYCWNCPTPLIPTILLDMPGFFEVVFGH